MAAQNKNTVFVIAAFLLTVSIILTGCLKIEQKSSPSTGHFLFAIVDDKGEQKQQFQVLAYTVIDDRNKELLAVIVPEDTKLEIPGAGYNRVKHALHFKDLSLSAKSIAKLIGIKDGQGNYIALDANLLGAQIDSIGGISLVKGETPLSGKEVVAGLRKAVRQKNMKAQQAIVSGMLNKLIEPTTRLDTFVVHAGGVPANNGHTSFTEKELRSVKEQISTLRNVTVGVLPGAAYEQDGFSYWVCEKAFLADMKTVIFKNGLPAGIRYLAEQRPVSNLTQP